jgi:plasmid replication initiation protein
MRIRLIDDRVFEGTAKQIVAQMRSISFGDQNLPLIDYCNETAARAGRMNGLEIMLTGETEEELATSLVDEMLRVGLASRA